METNSNALYQALLTHDARFDGRIFVGVTTTGIYCRPVCPARTPKPENCTFHTSAAAAEKAGFRPCLRCRPELAPGHSRVDAVGRLAVRAASKIEDGALSEQTVQELATRLGVSDRHLRRAVESAFGVSPIELAQTQRLLLAKRLLTDTRLSISEIAFASGFSSLRRFNALFKERYRMNPTDLRRTHSAQTGTENVPADTLTCELTYRPPFDWTELLHFTAGRSIRGVETSEDNRYLRTVRLKNRTGWIVVSPSEKAEKNTLRVELSASLAPALAPIISHVKRLFDLDAEPLAISERLGSLAEDNPGLRLPGAFDGFEMAVRAILGQQVSVKAATTLAGRLATRFGDPIETPFPALTHLPLTAERIALSDVAEIASLGIVTARAKSILALANEVAKGKIVLEPGVDLEETKTRLKALPGIGEWTSQYIAMRALGDPDAFPHTDLGIYKALNETNPKRVLQIAEAWRPWRSYATLHLWKSLRNTDPILTKLAPIDTDEKAKT